MNTPNRPSIYHLPLLLAGLLFLGACEDAPTSHVTEADPALREASGARSGGAAMRAARAGASGLQKGLATFRRATARYHRVEAAIEDGFEQILPCLSNPDGEGAIGIPYARLDRFDTNIDLSEPEILFYEPRKNGKLRLVGGEPVTPIEAWDAENSDPPSLFGRQFHANREHGLYGLHMWVWRHSPDGVLSFWNRNVSCQFAEA